ncbi:hypothetical protein [Flaviflagellibacter deserti]|jgi:hypothetical protein|uniref:LTXXQ motif family protein n=1 Tax=Flaviflagellibacter deserti TaxID=2267266 RepID=A0ABV9YWN5_9HYPH
MEFRTVRTLCLALALGISLTPVAATALTSDETAKVVTIIEKLQPSRGKVAYDEGEADQWFEDDSAENGLIGKAGFDQQGWKTSFDAVLKGFLASIPQAEIDGLLEQVRTHFRQARNMTPEQRTAALNLYDEQVAIIRALREEGRAYADTVRPFQDRLRRVVSTNGD